MANFLENFRNFVGGAPVNDIPRRNEDPNLPSLYEPNNSREWRNRVAVPFSYSDGTNNKRSYGIIYMPESAAWEISSTGSTDAEELQTYGAETMDGISLTPKGVQKLFDKYRDSFRIETDLVSPEDSAAPLRGASALSTETSHNPLPGVKVSNSGALRRLQNNIVGMQGRNLRAFNRQSIYPAQNDFVNYLRRTRGGR